MLRPLAAVALAVMILAAATGAGLLLAACGGSSTASSTTQTAANAERAGVSEGRTVTNAVAVRPSPG